MFETPVSLGIITYDAPHRKTEEVVKILVEKDQISNITILAAPFVERQKREVVIEHRPDQKDSLHTHDLAKKYHLDFVLLDGSKDVSGCDCYLIGGAGILAPELIKGKKVINAHPGIIPSVRGLDAFKWSIYHGIELGVTLHFIDECVDAGQVISIKTTPVYADDCLQSLARRHYELELEMTSNFLCYFQRPAFVSYPSHRARMRMPADIEYEMIKRFESYKQFYAKERC